MSEQKFKVGDRVRVTFEDTVHYVDAGITSLYDSDIDIFVENSELFTVEKIAPILPTTPGSVVRDESRTFLLHDDGFWYSQGGGKIPAGWSPFCLQKVIFDAGKAS